MNQNPNNKPKIYDLEDRTLKFTQRILEYVKILKKTLANSEVSKQLIRASGSVGANYIEANESLGRKDFLMKIKTCKKEAKESRYWLILTELDDKDKLTLKEKDLLITEATELMKIFGAILEKSR